MELTLRRRLAAGAATVVALGGAGSGAALACGGDGHDLPAARMAFTLRVAQHGVQFRQPALLRSVTSYLGISRADLAARVAAGETLAQIADATPGKSADGLVAAIVKSARTRLDALVARGALSASVEQRLLARLSEAVRRLVEGRPVVPPRPGSPR